MPIKRILLVQFVSEIGDTVFLSSISLFLLHQSYSATQAVGSVAITALPNLLLGPWLGKWVDQSKKLPTYIALNLSLALGEILLLGGAGWIFPSTRMPSWGIPILLFCMAIVYSPLQTLIQHYMIPALANDQRDEVQVYSLWETYRTAATLMGALISFLVLLYVDPGWLFVFDAASFCGAAILMGWFFKNREWRKTETINANSRSPLLSWNSSILMSVLFMWIAALAISPLTENMAPLGIKQFHLSESRTVLAVSFVAAAEWLGSLLFRQFIPDLYKQCKKMSLLLFSLHLVPLFIFTLASAWSNLTLAVLALFLIGILGAPWHLNNTLLLRAHISKDRYGEFFGYVRIPRAGLTILGATGFAYCIDMHFVFTAALTQCFIVVLTILLGIYLMRPNELPHQKS